METYYVAVHCTPAGPLYFRSHSPLDARQHLADRIRMGLCRPDDAMAIVEFPQNQTIYMRLRHNTVAGLVGSSQEHVHGSRSYFARSIKLLTTSLRLSLQ